MKDKKFNRFYFLIFLFLFLSFLVTASANAATYYVATNGSDSNPGTEAQPWRTIYYGAEQLYPGDTLLVKQGTYAPRSNTGAFYIPGIQPARSGTQSQPITIKAYPGHSVTIDGTLSNAPAIGSYARNWIIYDGFYIYRGCMYIQEASNVTVQNCEMQYGAAEDTNHINMVRIAVSANTIIRNNKIHGNKNAGSGYNMPAIMMYQ